MRRNIFFDLDGTLLDTIDDLTAADNYALRTLGYPEVSVEDVRAFVGDGVKQLLLRSLPKGHADDIETALALFRGNYSVHSADSTRIYPGVIEVMTELQERGYRMAVVSNKPQYAVETLVTKFFPMIEVKIGEQPGRNMKPAPDMCSAAMLALGCRREECIYVGDSDTDILTAANVGIPCISAAWGFRGREFLEQNGAKYIADYPQDILRFIGEENALE